MKPYVAKKAISLILLFSIGGVGVSAAHAQSEKLEGVESASYTATKEVRSTDTVPCWFDSPPYDDEIQNSEVVEDVYTSTECSDYGGERVYRINE